MELDVNISSSKEYLFGVCKRFHNESAIVEEPYIPYFPSDWCGVLLIAESQNLSKKNAEYVSLLKGLSRLERYDRLAYSVNYERLLRIQPWIDGYMPLSAAVCTNMDPSSMAVTNAIPWSWTSNSGCNLNPAREHFAKAVEFNREVLLSSKPNVVITYGSMAKEVVSSLRGDWRHVALIHPSHFGMIHVRRKMTGALVQGTVVEEAMARHSRYFSPNRTDSMRVFANYALGVSKGLLR